MKRREFLFAAGVAALPKTRQAAPRFEEIAKLVADKMAQYHVPGVALGIYKDGETVLRGFGITSTDNAQPVTPDTVFSIASISKTFTATAMMKLVEQGRMDLKAPVRKYLPEFRVKDETVSREVAPWHLLTHTPGWEGQLTGEDRGLDTLNHFVTSDMKDLPPLSQPGTVWSYNNAGFALTGRIIEVVTGKNIHDAFRDLVLQPVGLTHTFTRSTEAMTYRFSLGHRQAGNATQVIRPYQTGSSTTAGGFTTTITDMLKYANFHLAKSALLDQMKVPLLTKNSTEDEMGIGWHIRKVGGVNTFAHGGTVNGHCLLVQLVPERNLAFSILTNHTDGWQLVQDIERAILKSYEGLALTPNQRIGHRGVNEAMTGHASALNPQPQLDEYTGAYRRIPGDTSQVRADGSRLSILTGGTTPVTLSFYSKDAAYVTSGAYVGQPYEFIRTPDGKVGWMRINGRVARKD